MDIKTVEEQVDEKIMAVKQAAVAKLLTMPSSELIKLANEGGINRSSLEMALAKRLEHIEAILDSHNASHAALII